MKNSIEPTAARKVPMMNVAEMTLLIRMPISCEVSKFRDTARMAMPIFVWLISRTSSTTRTMVRNGVMMVTREVSIPKTVTRSEIQGIAG